VAYAVAGKLIVGQPLYEPRVNYGPAFANYSWQFFLTGTATPANIYQDQNLTTPFSPTANKATADSNGRFPPIYLDPSVIYKAQLYNASSVLVRTQDPYQAPLPTWGTSQLQATGPKITAFNEVTTSNSAGGTGNALTVNATPPGGACVKISGTIPGAVTLEIDSSATTGAQTATFTATNKPGIATSAPVAWLPIKCDGTVYYTPLWRGDTFVPLPPIPTAYGQTISSDTVEFNGDGSTSLTGVGATASPPAWYIPTTTGIGSSYYINITKTGGLSGLTFTHAVGSWTNIGSGAGLTIGSTGQGQVTGTYQLSTSGTGSPVVASGTISCQNGNGPQNTNYSGTASLVLGGNGTATVGGSGATNWYLPTTGNIGSSYWVNVTFGSSSPTGLSFTAAQGSWTNITNGGLTIGMSSFFNNATISGSYQLSSNSGGTAIVGQGSISLTGTGVGPTYSGTENLVLAGNGTATLAGSGSSNWYNPTTTNIGSSYWVSIARSGGTSGVNFTAAQGSFTNITNGGLTIGITNYFTNVSVNGTMSVAPSAGGTPVLATYSVSLSGNGTGPSYSGTENLALNSDGSTTINGSGSTNWYTPSTASIGSSYWVEITGIGGGPGTFNNAVGSWVNIGGGLNIGTTNFFNTTTVTGTLNYSSSVTGSPVVGTSAISVSGNGIGPAYSGTENLVLASNGTTTINGGGVTNWYTPTTGSIGNSYWVEISGVSGPGFTAAQGSWVNIDGGLTIGTNNFLSNVTTTGTLNYSSSSSGSPNIGTSSLSLTGNGTGPAYSGAANFVMNSNGTVTLNGVGQTNWYTPTTSNIGNSYWVQMTRTGGDAGITFNNGIGTWTQLSSAFTVGLTNVVGNHSVNGTYSISSSASGSPVVGSGTITLTQNITSLIHVYTSGSGTETIPVGATNMTMEAWGGGGSGGGGGSAGHGGSGGAGGGYTITSNFSVSSQNGNTLTYSVGAGVAGVGGGFNGNNGNPTTVNAGTITGWNNVTCNGGAQGITSSNANTSGGTVTNTNANTTNTTGNNGIGQSGGFGGAGGAGIAGGIGGDGAPYGAGSKGGDAVAGSSGASQGGAVVFYYT